MENKFINKLYRKLSGQTYPYTGVVLEMSKFRKKTYGEIPQVNKKISVVLLTLNRLIDTKRTLKSLYKTTVPFDLIVIDQKSTDGTLEFIEKFVKTKNNVMLIRNKENTGVSGGRLSALEYVQNEFTAYIDNDMVFIDGYFENLVRSFIDENVAAVVGKIVLPNKKIQLNKPQLEIKDGWALFFDLDENKFFDDSTTLQGSECGWIPGVAMWRTKVLKQIEIDKNVLGAYEDNEYSFRVAKAGYKFVSCPQSLVLHIKAEFTKALEDKNYTAGRFNKDKIKNAAKIFYQKHGLYLALSEIKESCRYFGFNNVEEFKEFVSG